MATCLSSEASLLLGKSKVSCSSFSKFYFIGAHSFDFSGVRDDKCHKSIDNGQVQSSFYDYAVHLNIARGTTKAWVDTITGYLIGCKFGQDVAPLSLVGILLAQFVLC